MNLTNKQLLIKSWHLKAKEEIQPDQPGFESEQTRQIQETEPTRHQEIEYVAAEKLVNYVAIGQFSGDNNIEDSNERLEQQMIIDEEEENDINQFENSNNKIDLIIEELNKSSSENDFEIDEEVVEKDNDNNNKNGKEVNESDKESEIDEDKQSDEILDRDLNLNKSSTDNQQQQQHLNNNKNDSMELDNLENDEEVQQQVN
jgi:hypothetical protein